MKPSDTPTILALDTNLATLSSVGGKGANLARLVQAGFPVPPAQIISTAAYSEFVHTNQLSETIADALQDTTADDAAALESASDKIRSAFRSGQLPARISNDVRDMYTALGRGPVAVRSSATAEDLPGYSFAGQQDTYLNVVGEEALLKAVIDCWSSLWTARVIGYRARNGIDHETARLAVIVQAMVSSETSGVLFTANPLTGKRGEIVIDAIYGLGEALVSGQVEPDHYLIDSQDRILSRTLGQKSTVIRGQEGGGTLTFQEDNSTKQALTDAQIFELARLGRAVASLFGAPQDIEWAVQDHKIWLLQSRPITTLYPLPENISPEPLKVFLSFGAVQGMLDPMTPLGRDAIRGLFVGGARIFGARYTLEDLPTLADAGERLWVNFTGLLKNRLGRKILLAALDYVEPGAKQSLLALIEEGSLPLSRGVRPMITFQLLKVVLPTLSRAVTTLLRPEAQRDRLLEDIETWLGDLQTRITAAETPTELLALIRAIPADAIDFLLPQFVPRFGIGMAAFLTEREQGLL
ncbi:MAG: PEP/pyruvate-binding domain-containing protein, partial [Anaerolineales bacterium]